MDIVGGQDGGLFLGDAENLTFFRVEFHAIFGFPLLECVEVSLKDTGVVFCLYCAIEETIVSKQSNFGSFCQVFVNVVDVRQE